MSLIILQVMEVAVTNLTFDCLKRVPVLRFKACWEFLCVPVCGECWYGNAGTCYLDIQQT